MDPKENAPLLARAADVETQDPFVESRHLSPLARVYVNRNLRMSSIGAIGFDLDHTLAHYDPIPVERLAFRITQAKLVEKRGYPPRILQISYDPEFVIRGLVIDRRRGNILKMDYYSYVARAFHGRRLLTSEERKRAYRHKKIRLSYDSFVSVDTAFHLPEVYLYLALVDDAEARRADHDGRKIDYYKIYSDVREMIDEAHADLSIKSEIMAQPGQFLRDEEKLAATLDEFRRCGKKVFLLTNSEFYYTDALLSHLFRSSLGRRASWRDFFDLIIVRARKPAFFLNRSGAENALTPVETERGGPPVYEGGDASFLQRTLGYRGDQILYFGDHTYGDILRSKKTLGWRTAMIVPELEHEIATTGRIAADLRKLAGLGDERETAQLRKATLAREIARNNGAPIDALQRSLATAEFDVRRLDAEIETLEDRCHAAYNRHWGPLFREGNETSRFAHQVKDFACLYTSRVSNFLSYPADQYFQSPGSFMPHEL
jgi:HAD superfamily 5'-nucleotidase-like hydrolase